MKRVMAIQCLEMTIVPGITPVREIKTSMTSVIQGQYTNGRTRTLNRLTKEIKLIKQIK